MYVQHSSYTGLSQWLTDFVIQLIICWSRCRSSYNFRKSCICAICSQTASLQYSKGGQEEALYCSIMRAVRTYTEGRFHWKHDNKLVASWWTACASTNYTNSKITWVWAADLWPLLGIVYPLMHDPICNQSWHLATQGVSLKCKIFNCKLCAIPYKQSQYSEISTQHLQQVNALSFASIS